MGSEKQRLANQRNAQKSTGPKTEEGKARSRQNALKHGLTGEGVVLPKSMRKAVAQRTEEFSEHLQPVDPLEDVLVQRAALASVRLERAMQTDLAKADRRARQARTRWETRQAAKVREAVRRLGKDPHEGVRALRSSCAGCDWLLSRWGELARVLERDGGWADEEVGLAVRLLGFEPGAAEVEGVWLRAQAARGEGDEAADPGSATALAELVAERVEELHGLRSELWRRQDGPERREAEACALVDTSKEGMTRQRYETANEMSLHRSLARLVKHRKMEPDHQTLKRWDRQKKHVWRIWNGTDYIKHPPDEQPEPVPFGPIVEQSGPIDAADAQPRPAAVEVLAVEPPAPGDPVREDLQNEAILMKESDLRGESCINQDGSSQPAPDAGPKAVGGESADGMQNEAILNQPSEGARTSLGEAESRSPSDSGAVESGVWPGGGSLLGPGATDLGGPVDHAA